MFSLIKRNVVDGFIHLWELSTAAAPPMKQTGDMLDW